jgi:hypothetical protein
MQIQELCALNPSCADCDALSPDWTVINLGILICHDCSGVHRSFGTHISKVVALSLRFFSLSNF